MMIGGAGVLLAVIALALVYALIRWAVLRAKPPFDTVGNGIVIGDPKAFDNRSLTLRIERLNAGLAALNVVSQNVTERLGTIQERSSSESSRSLTVAVKTSPLAQTETKPAQAKNDAAEEKPSAASAKAAASEPKPSASEAKLSDAKPSVTGTASDLLAEQLNLASQIVNLQVLNERSLTDRLFAGGTRLQTVLGFQVSIVPPAGCEDSVAVIEVSVRVKTGNQPVSLVALIPQERTYNAQSVSKSASSIQGSAVDGVVTVGAGAKGQSERLFVHRDSDTISFERDPGDDSSLFAPDKHATFGWEFRPVLGRRAVTAGTRQMMAVIAIPLGDDAAEDDVVLEIKRRSYWRRYDGAKQTSRPKLGWNLFALDRSRRQDAPSCDLSVQKTVRIQSALAPVISDVRWFDSGGGTATVVVKGERFFSGTRVVVGGTTYSEEAGTLTLKSERSLEFATTIASLMTGNAVLSGRFGAAIPLEIPPDQRPAPSLVIKGAFVEGFPYTKDLRMTIDVKAQKDDGTEFDLTLDQLNALPDALVFLGTDLVPMPYDYAGGKVTAWVPRGMLLRDSWVLFRIPFCGSDYVYTVPFSYSEPTVTRMGGDDAMPVFRINRAGGFSNVVSVELDRIYDREPDLVPLGRFDLRLCVPGDVVERYQQMVLRIGKEIHVLALPSARTPRAPMALDTSGEPPRIASSSIGPIEWSGTSLDDITSATLLPAGTPEDFVAFDGGRRIAVSFRDGTTGKPGKGEIEFTTASGEIVRAPFFVTSG